MGLPVGDAAYHLPMTAPFDAAQGTGQGFTDALSGSDGTADPAVTMPVLDVYPDALSAQLPEDLYPVLMPPVVADTGRPGVRAEPVLGPAAVLTPAQQRQAQQRLAQQRAGQQRAGQQPYGQPGSVQRSSSAARPSGQRPAAPQRPAPQRAVPQRSVPQRGAPTAPPSPGGWQGVANSAADMAALFRASLPGNPTQVDRQSYQATHPQSTGSGAPMGVAPAAPMASQYSGRGQSRNDAHDRSQERRRRTSVPTRKSGSGWAVLVALGIILFASGIGQRIIDLITGLLNR